MGKLPKMKSRTQSAKSRSARRTSPSTDTIDVKPAVTETKESGIDLSALAARQGAGITKKKRQRTLSRHQRLRKEKGIARADVVIEKMEKKVVKSKKKGKEIKERAATWEDLNGTKPAKQDSRAKAVADMEVDVDESEVEEDRNDEQTASAEAALVLPTDLVASDTPVEMIPGDDDGIDAIT